MHLSHVNESNFTGRVRLADESDDPLVLCAVFAPGSPRCYNLATTTVPHPVLGDVPACACCHDDHEANS